MKLALTSLIFCLLTSGPVTTVSAVTADDMRTGNFLNGRYWTTATQNQKSGYLFGLQEGPLLVSYAHTDDDSYKQALIMAKSTLDRYWFVKNSEKEVQDVVDDFYKDPANIRVRVIQAYIYALSKLNGSSQVQLQELLDACRKDAARF